MWKSTIKESIIAENRVECSSELVFVSALRFIKERFFQEFLQQKKEKEFAKVPSLDEIQWVLTVPAVWSDNAKDKMKLWAGKAGLIYTGPKEIPNHLLLVNESVKLCLYTP